MSDKKPTIFHVYETHVYEVEVQTDELPETISEIASRIKAYASQSSTWFHKSGWHEPFPAKRIKRIVERVHILPPRRGEER